MWGRRLLASFGTGSDGWATATSTKLERASCPEKNLLSKVNYEVLSEKEY